MTTSDDTPIKRCSKCQIEYPATIHFFKWRGTRFDSWCRECYRTTQNQWREQNLEQSRAISQKYQKQHRAYRTKYEREYRKQHRDNYLESKRKYYRENKDKYRAWDFNRRKIEYNATGSHTAEDIKLQYESQKARCWWCGGKLSKKYHVDHRIPLSRGGTNNPDNLVISCIPCNLSKGDKLPHEWSGRLI